MTVSSSTQYNRYDDQRAAEQRAAHEPSMEEILASIRRIIADDEVLPLTRSNQPPSQAQQASVPRAPQSAPQLPPLPSRAAPAPSSLAQNSPGLAALRNSITPASAENSGLEGAAAERFASIVRKPPPSLLDKRPQPRDYAAPPPPPADYNYQPPRYPEQAPQSYDQGQTALLSPQANASVAASFQNLASSLGSDPAMSGHVTELLKPMLKQWLDDNLPVLVERLVRAEIERVARGGRDL
jgi:uncharacterized protein